MIRLMEMVRTTIKSTVRGKTTMRVYREVVE